MGCKNGKERNKTSLAQSALQLAAKAEAGDHKRSGDGRCLFDKYKLGSLLGQGGYGVVYECTNKETGELLAVKMIDRVESTSEEIETEIFALTEWAHPVVVKLYDVYYESVFVCLVMALYPGGHLINVVQKHWKEHGEIPLSIVQNVMKMAFQGCEWLHSNHVIHRDLKGDNCLVDKLQLEDPECRIYLADFGTVLPCPPGKRFTRRAGTRSYWAPEVWDKDYSLKMDIWSLSVIMFAITCGHFPFKGEAEARTLPIEVPERLDADGVDLLLLAMERNEEKRITSDVALTHPWLSQIKLVAETTSKVGVPIEAELCEEPAYVGVQERRFNLVERLETAHLNKRRSLLPSSDLWLTKPFQAMNARTGVPKNLAWWTPDEVRQAQFYDRSKAGQTCVDLQALNEICCQASRDPVLHQLEMHDLNTNSFGLGKAKRFDDFVRELNSGAARLMLDASQHKKLVRVVHVVLLRVVHGEGADRKYLIKAGEIFPDGRERTDINQLSGNKRLPHENGIGCVQRLVKERMHTFSGHLKFDFEKKECYEEEEDSPSYPGVPTVYQKEIYEAVVTATDPSTLSSMGLAGSGRKPLREQDKQNYVRIFEWLDEEQCADRQIKLKAPQAGHNASVYVDPPAGYEQEALEDFLQESHVDVSTFGQAGMNTLADLSDELRRGESVLEQTEDGKLIRVVDLVILHAVNVEGNTLVELSNKARGGVTGQGGRLPAMKRRAEENAFWAAQRLITQVLKLNEDLVHLDVDNVFVVEEQAESKGYVGLPTLYRRRIIPALVKKI